MEYQMKMELEKLKGQIQLELAAMKIQSESSNVNTREAGRIEAARMMATKGVPIDQDLSFTPDMPVPLPTGTSVGDAAASEVPMMQPSNIGSQEQQVAEEDAEPGMEDFTFNV